MSKEIQFHVLATPTSEGGFGENVFLGKAKSAAEAVSMCKDAGYTVIEEGAEIQQYDAEDAPFIFSYEADGFGAISVPVEPSKIADEYIGGRFTSIPQDHFSQDGVSAEAVEDDGEYTTFEFEDGSRCKINADGDIVAA